MTSSCSIFVAYVYRYLFWKEEAATSPFSKEVSTQVQRTQQNPCFYNRNQNLRPQKLLSQLHKLEVQKAYFPCQYKINPLRHLQQVSSIFLKKYL